MKVVIFTVLFALIAAVSASPTPDAQNVPWDCPKNEKYYKCSLEECYTHCEHINSYPACAQLAPGCYEPACLCVAGYLRNAEGKCIPEWQCPEFQHQ